MARKKADANGCLEDSWKYCLRFDVRRRHVFKLGSRYMVSAYDTVIIYSRMCKNGKNNNM